jgi:hypothetical protein
MKVNFIPVPVKVGNLRMSTDVPIEVEGMSDAELGALSVQKWMSVEAVLIARGEALLPWSIPHKHGDLVALEDGNIHTCALCMGHPGCDGCPVYLETGRMFCRKTPYVDYYHSCTLHDAIRAARDEINFLLRLFPSVDALEVQERVRETYPDYQWER